MTNDGYVQELGEGEYYPAELPEVDFDHAEVDPANPGFASLLHALRGVRAGHFDASVLEAYVVGLSPRLEAAFQQWEQVAGQPLQEMGLGDEQIAQLQGAFSATEALLQEMDLVLGLIERGLTEGDEPSLDEAEQRLANVHQEIKAALG
ncbi:MAG: hypothetical protein KF760_02590 [Candidatus Eremiobacteraeota bacterium]|nr:hypothetical protein [Candidatus Eremiobacteraeota bacterium]MCW5868786.1 hypothetical protein [Candidatus Eremiobacteraeota bacterium]